MELSDRIAKLSPEQRKLLEAKLKEKKITILDRIENVSQDVFSSMSPAEEKEYYPLSGQQEWLYSLDQKENIGLAYNVGTVKGIEGKLDLKKVQEVFAELVNRHEPFRTSFEIQNGEVVQRIHRKIDFKVDFFEEADDSKVKTIIHNYLKPFDLSQAPVLRVGMIKVSEVKHILIFDTHFMLCDCLSEDVLDIEFAKLYYGQELDTPTLHYKDFSVWQHSFYKTNEYKKQEKYWMDIFKNGIPKLRMPLDYSRPQEQTFQGETIGYTFSPEEMKEIRKLGQKNNATLNATLTLVYAILLSKYCEQEKVVLATTGDGRQHSDVQSMIGGFINSLPLVIAVDENATFLEMLRATNSNILETLSNQDYPFIKLVQKLENKIDPVKNPVFDTMLLLHNEEIVIPKTDEDQATISTYVINRRISQLDFMIHVMINKEGEGLFDMEYNTSLFKSETMSRLLDGYTNLMQAVLKNPNIKISDLELISDNWQREDISSQGKIHQI